jgi:hypothetical protein
MESPGSGNQENQPIDPVWQDFLATTYDQAHTQRSFHDSLHDARTVEMINAIELMAEVGDEQELAIAQDSCESLFADWKDQIFVVSGKGYVCDYNTSDPGSELVSMTCPAVFKTARLYRYYKDGVDDDGQIYSQVELIFWPTDESNEEVLDTEIIFRPGDIDSLEDASKLVDADDGQDEETIDSNFSYVTYSVNISFDAMKMLEEAVATRTAANESRSRSIKLAADVVRQEMADLWNYSLNHQEHTLTIDAYRWYFCPGDSDNFVFDEKASMVDLEVSATTNLTGQLTGFSFLEEFNPDRQLDHNSLCFQLTTDEGVYLVPVACTLLEPECDKCGSRYGFSEISE